MREMKESGYRWIGEIPKFWEIVKVKDGFTQKKSKAYQDEPVILSLARDAVKVRDISSNEGQIAASYYEYNPVEPMDMLLNPMDLQSGANCSLSRVSGVISPAYVNLRYKKGFDPRYYDYYFKYQYWSYAFFSFGKGVSYDNRWTLNTDTLMRYPLLVPPLSEQHRIADFLDRKCAQIDEISKKIQEEIDTLEEYKRSVITEAVTKGLDPNVEMKDSGIEWIGKVPKAWIITKFKYIAKIKPNLVNPNEYRDSWQVGPDLIEKNSGRLIAHRTVDEAGVDSWNHYFKYGQILYSKIRPVLNKVIIAPYDGLCSADMYPIEAQQCRSFLFYIMLSNCFVSQVDVITRDRIKMPKINQEELNKLIVVLPDEKEQERISTYITSKITSINTAIDKKQQQLLVIDEYKKSLIYEYVTGKKEVPDGSF